ncbi:MAG: hypothetical protein ABEJ36_02010 [Candidatus Nanosalina sp.]
MSISMEEEVKKFLSNRSRVFHEVSEFRNTVEKNLEEVMRDTESGFSETLAGTSLEPRVRPVFTPELTDLDENRFYIAASVALFDHANSGRNVSNILKGTREAKVGETADALRGGFEKGEFEWGAKYEREDNSILLNELPEKILPDKRGIPNIMAFYWNAVNTAVDTGIERSHGWTVLDVEARTAHEMTHAFNEAETESLKNRKTAAVDEAAAMAVTYAFSGNMSSDDYAERGVDPEALRKSRKIFKELVDRQDSREEAVTKTREKSVEAIEILRSNDVPVEKAFSQLTVDSSSSRRRKAT